MFGPPVGAEDPETNQPLGPVGAPPEISKPPKDPPADALVKLEAAAELTPLLPAPPVAPVVPPVLPPERKEESAVTSPPDGATPEGAAVTPPAPPDAAPVDGVPPVVPDVPDNAPERPPARTVARIGRGR